MPPSSELYLRSVDFHQVTIEIIWLWAKAAPAFQGTVILVLLFNFARVANQLSLLLSGDEELVVSLTVGYEVKT